MSPEIHVMLDLETLDTQPSAVVLSFGAVAFDPYNPDEDFSNTIYGGIPDSIDYQVRGMKRTISGDTLRWWLTQGDQAKKVFLASSGYIYDVLDNFAEWIKGLGDSVPVWGNGAAFDNTIMASLYGTPPWAFHQDRCYRTLRNLLPHVELPPFEGVKHNALDDAVNQARRASILLRELRKGAK